MVAGAVTWRMPMGAPRLLVLGHVTRDELDGGQTRLGGAASYAALAATRLGVETGLVTVAPPSQPLLEPLRSAPRLALACAPSDVMTTFALDYRGGRRSLALRARARSVVASDIPEAWRSAPVAYAGPVAGECGRALIESLAARFIGVGLQGWLRRAGGDGAIEPALADEALRPPRVQLAVVSEEDHPEVDAIASRFAAAGATVAITRGARGATLLAAGARIEIAAAPANEVDPTGAGDVFGVVLTLRLAAGDPPEVAGAAAAAAAARVVEGPGLGRLAT
jgi:sugar/nucleoside kinase (ribokinase family)